jgi:hypothetical protein
MDEYILNGKGPGERITEAKVKVNLGVALSSSSPN